MDETYYLINNINMVVGTTEQGEDGTYTVTWHDDENTTSQFDNLHEYYNAVLGQGIRVASEEDMIVQTHLSLQNLMKDLKRKDEEIANLTESLRASLRETDEAKTKRTEDVDYLVGALRDTIDHVGSDKLPPAEGWPWYDALKKYRPNLSMYWKNTHEMMKAQLTEHSVESHIEDRGMDADTTKDLLKLQNQVRELEGWLCDVFFENRTELYENDETLLDLVLKAVHRLPTAQSVEATLVSVPPTQATLQQSIKDLLSSTQLVPAKDGLFTENEKGAYVFKFS